MSGKGKKKKTTEKAKVNKLKIKKETVKNLTDEDLDKVVGGMIKPDSYSRHAACPSC